MESAQDKYIREHSSPQSEALAWIEKQTYIRTNYPRMLSGAVQGRLLTILVELCQARRVLEIGTFTGYSALCLAYGLPEGGLVDTLEINDELEDLIREGWERSGLSGRIKLHLGNAIDTLESFAAEGRSYDLIYIDANHSEYCASRRRMRTMVRRGSLLLVDDVMLGGKVYADKPSVDKQTQGLIAFNEMVAGDDRVECVMLPIRDGLSVIRRKA